jgi:hypothetical protein
MNTNAPTPTWSSTCLVKAKFTPHTNIVARAGRQRTGLESGLS